MTQTSELGAHIPIIYHFAMLQDQQRMEGFREAIFATVKPGAIVLELGGGSGVLSFYAAQNASKVYCVEQIPGNAKAAREILDANPNGDRVEVICADAFEYLPPEPVDVVICEMLHVGMLREKQIEMIESFKQRYTAKFGAKLPVFIPEAFIQAIQPIQYNYNFFGYNAPISLFQIPGSQDGSCIEVSDPALYQIAQYKDHMPREISWSGSFNIKQSGKLNAFRLILKNILTIIPEENRAVHWHNQYLIIPLRNALEVSIGDKINIAFSYLAGSEIEDFINALNIEHVRTQNSLVSKVEKDYVAPAQKINPFTPTFAGLAATRASSDHFPQLPVAEFESSE